MAKTPEQLKSQGHTGPIYEVGEPVPLSRRRTGFRTKGVPYGRFSLIRFEVAEAGRPGKIHIRKKANGRRMALTATPEHLRHFMPMAPDSIYRAMLGLGTA